MIVAYQAIRQHLVTAILLIIASVPIARVAGAENPKPNFVVLLADDLGYGDLGIYGHPTIATPNLDRMAAEGMKLTSFYAAGPACSPSRAGLLTGRYPMRSGVYRVLRLEDTGGLPPSEVTMAEALGAAGYQTLALGKWHLGHRSPFLPTENGFARFHGLLYSNNMDEPDRPLRLYRDATAEPGDVEQALFTRSETEEAAAFIRGAGDRPFLLYLAYPMPHVPLHASESFAGRSKRGAYGDAVQEIDWSVGEILRAVRETGLDHRTLLVFTSDNGPWLPRKLDGGSAGLLRDGKNTTYEGGMRVPCIVRWPGRIPAGQVRAELTSNLDLMPTFLELAGIGSAGHPVLDGRSLLPLLEGHSFDDERSFYYFQGALVEAIREGKWKYRAAPESSSPNASGDSMPTYLAALERITTDGRSLAAFEIDSAARLEAQLYDLEADPSERFNLATEHPELARRMRARMQAFAHGLVPGPGYHHLAGEFIERARKRLGDEPPAGAARREAE